MDSWLDSLIPGNALLPDVMLVFTSADGSDAALAEVAEKRRKTEVSSSAGCSEHTPGAAASVIPELVLVEQLVSGGRGVSVQIQGDVLKRGSEYFEARLARWQHQGLVTDRGQSVMVERVAEEELPACCQLLRCLICGGLTEAAATDAMLLLKAWMLSDRYGMPACTTACLQALNSLQPGQLSEQQVCDILQLPEPPTHRELFQNLQTKCVQRLLQLYAEPRRIVDEEDRRRTFCGLPFVAVHRWAEADELTVDIEDNVLVLLNLWVHVPQGQGDSEEQKQQLSACVRVLQLSGWFFTSVLPQVAWFGVTGGKKCLQAAAYARSKMVADGDGDEFVLPDPCPLRHNLPGSWSKSARPQPPGEQDSCIDPCCPLSPSREKIAEAINAVLAGGGPVLLESRMTSFCGVMWQGMCHLTHVDGFPPYARLGLSFKTADEQTLLPGVSLEDLLPVRLRRLGYHMQERDGVVTNDDVEDDVWLHVVGSADRTVVVVSDLLDAAIRESDDLDPEAFIDDCMDLRVEFNIER